MALPDHGQNSRSGDCVPLGAQASISPWIFGFVRRCEALKRGIEGAGSIGKNAGANAGEAGNDPFIEDHGVNFALISLDSSQHPYSFHPTNRQHANRQHANRGALDDVEGVANAAQCVIAESESL